MITTVDFNFILEDLERFEPVVARHGGRKTFVAKTTASLTGGEAKDFLLDVAQAVFERSQVLVPVDTGALKASGVIAPWGLGWRIKYYTPYAAYVHEILYNRHTYPTQAKYLQDAFVQEMFYLTSTYGFYGLPDFDVDLEVNVDLGVILTLAPASGKSEFSWRYFLGGD